MADDNSVNDMLQAAGTIAGDAVQVLRQLRRERDAWHRAFDDLAAQVRRVGIVADVQIGDGEIAFGENYDAHQTHLALLATIGTLNRLVLEASNMTRKAE